MTNQAENLKRPEEVAAHPVQPAVPITINYSNEPPLQKFFSPPENQVYQADNYVNAEHGEGFKQDPFYFDDASVRRGFIRKVFSIVGVQLAVVLSLTCWFLFEEHTKKFVQAHSKIVIAAVVLQVFFLIVLICFGELRRKAPINYILLSVFTVCEGFVAAVLASYFDAMGVALAFGFTALVSFGLCMYTFQTKWDFTMIGGVLFASLLIFVFVGFASIFLFNQIFQVLCAAIGAIFFSIYFVYDIQIMTEGTHYYQLSPEEYVFAALNISIDIIRICMYKLGIVRYLR